MTPWNGAVSRVRPRSEHKSIRGHISGPMPIPSTDPVDDERPRPATAWRASRQQAELGVTQQHTTARRSKSTLKSAFNRLLGRKKKASTYFTDSGIPPEITAQHHRSDPMGDTRPPKTVESKRSASLPVTEFDRALRSHSISPEDVLAIRSAGSSLNAESRAPSNRAEASDATLALLPCAHSACKSTGLAPRPASSHARHPGLANWSEDPDDIGRAITSDSSGWRRRSRSLSAFPSSDSALISPARRRSHHDVFAWRESCDARAVTPPTCGSLVDVPETLAAGPAADKLESTDDDENHFPDFSHEAASLHITEAAGFDLRITDLEARMARLEHVVAELTESLVRFAPPSADLGSRWLQSSVVTPEGKKVGHGDVSIPCHHLNHGWDASKLSHTAAYADEIPISDGSRPLSLETVRVKPNKHPLGPGDSAETITTDHYLTLVGLLETERSAREMLEAQVRSLGHQFYMVSNPTSRPSGGSSAFDLDEEEDDGVTAGSRGRNRDDPLAARGEDGQASKGDDSSDPMVTSAAAAARVVPVSRLAVGMPPSPVPQQQQQQQQQPRRAVV
ncbi:hypothetical protein CP532_4913 [Ophiocordyceps camponoti-leonardi (nom. inval.)]|nr:hypothetical protein CP532_4913 [Ophiocordyceps camponoti-leonardi (nom. inval.)]